MFLFCLFVHQKPIPTFSWIDKYLMVMVTKLKRLIVYRMFLGSSRPYP